jgi:hypothetical protein
MAAHLGEAWRFDLRGKFTTWNGGLRQRMSRFLLSLLQARSSLLVLERSLRANHFVLAHCVLPLEMLAQLLISCSKKVETRKKFVKANYSRTHALCRR